MITAHFLHSQHTTAATLHSATVLARNCLLESLKIALEATTLVAQRPCLRSHRSCGCFPHATLRDRTPRIGLGLPARYKVCHAPYQTCLTCEGDRLKFRLIWACCSNRTLLACSPYSTIAFHLLLQNCCPLLPFCSGKCHLRPWNALKKEKLWHTWQLQGSKCDCMAKTAFRNM
jgi:hypothetical protein